MKKALLGAVMIMGFLNFSFAQTATTTTKVEKQASHKTAAKSTAGKVKSEAKQTKADIKAAAKDAKSAATEPVTKSATAGNVKMKKDGTPDKRYKANKKM